MEGRYWYKNVWSLLCDRESSSTTLETILESLRRLREIFPDLFPLPPKVLKQYLRDNILVFTSNNSDDEIKRGAEAIRSHVDYPFIMYYFKGYATDPKLRCVLYKHTPDFELYKFNNVDKSATSFWKLISKEKEKICTFGESLSSQDKDRIHLNYDPANTDDSERAIDRNEGKWITVRSKKDKKKTECELILPSQVNDRDYIHLPAREDDFEVAKNKKGGKWILHCLDLETLDNIWQNLIPLYHKGVLIALKSCTAKSSIAERDPACHTKLIMCYTADADCKSSVKKAADSILMCTGYDLLMYYKSNTASHTGQYRHEGFINVTKYKFTVTGQMFERDDLRRWKKTIFSQEDK